jgi:outer membrane lipoprotein-sorting protein
MTKILSAFIILLFSTVLLQAQPSGYKPLKDAEDFKIKLNAAVSKLKTIESDFVQEKSLSIMTEPMSSKGRFWFRKPGMLRWQYFEPVKYTILLDGVKMYINDGQKTSSFDIKKNKIFSEVNNIMTDCLQGNIQKQGKIYKIAFFEGPKYYMIKLTPFQKQMKQFLKSIELYINKKDYSVDRLKMIELSNDFTSIEFINKKMNHEIPDSQFHLK